MKPLRILAWHELDEAEFGTMQNIQVDRTKKPAQRFGSVSF